MLDAAQGPGAHTESSLTFRARYAFYLRFAGLLLIPPGILLFLATPKNRQGLLPFVAVSIIGFAFSALWLSRFRLVLAPNSISYRSLFVPTRTLSPLQIETVYCVDSLNPDIVSTVFAIRSITGEEFRIAGGMFAPEAITTLRALESGFPKRETGTTALNLSQLDPSAIAAAKTRLGRQRVLLAIAYVAGGFAFILPLGMFLRFPSLKAALSALPGLLLIASTGLYASFRICCPTCGKPIGLTAVLMAQQIRLCPLCKAELYASKQK